MTHDESYIEILISKHLDGEISATEQRHLQEALDQDPQTRQLFDELQALHQVSRDAVSQTLDQGRPAEDILAAAFNQTDKATWWDRAQNMFFSQFTTGLAAGLLIALSLQTLNQYWPSQASSPNVAQDRSPIRTPLGRNVTPVASPNLANVGKGLYFVDDDGVLWNVDGLPETQSPSGYHRVDF